MGIAAAVVGGAVIGGVASNSASKRASSDAANATAAQAASASNELEFAKAQQARWDEVFGPTQDILSDYYNNLDPDTVAAKNVQNIQQGYQEYQKQIDTTLGQRGLEQSGLSAEITNQALYTNEMQKAQAISNAPQQVAEQQTNFLSLGMGIAPSLQSGVQSAYGAQQQVYNNQYSGAISRQNQADASFSSAMGSIGTGLGYFMPQTSSIPYDQQPGFIGPKLSY